MGKNNEDMAVFKSYLRRLLQDIKDIKVALDDGDIEKAKGMLSQLENDTQKDIED